jgi:hypothetical protein
MLVKEMKRFGHFFLEVVVRVPGKLTTTFDEKGVPWHWGLLSRLYSNALRSYQGRCVDCRGVVFRADPESFADDSLGWDNNLFSRGLEIIRVTGSQHITMTQRPHITTLAREMNKVLHRSVVGSSWKEPPSDLWPSESRISRQDR